MTPHQQITHPDGSVSVRDRPGGRWEVTKEVINGRHMYGCDASVFCNQQNRFIMPFHIASVREHDESRFRFASERGWTR